MHTLQKWYGIFYLTVSEVSWLSWLLLRWTIWMNLLQGLTQLPSQTLHVWEWYPSAAHSWNICLKNKMLTYFWELIYLQRIRKYTLHAKVQVPTNVAHVAVQGYMCCNHFSYQQNVFIWLKKEKCHVFPGKTGLPNSLLNFN